MKKLLIILLLIPTLLTAQTVQDYVRDFQSDAINYGKYLTKSAPKIVLVNGIMRPVINGQSVNAAAYVDHDIATIYFSTVSTTYCYELKPLVYHELGHYYLGRNHKNNIDANTGMAVSIMTSIWVEEWDTFCIETKQEYIDELFTYY